MLVEGLVTYLAADTGVKAQLGTPSTRVDKTNGIFPVLAPDGAAIPYLVLSQVSGEASQTFEGAVTPTARWRFSACGSTYRAAKLLAEALKAAMLPCLGAMPTGNVYVQNAALLMEADDSEAIGSHGTLWCTHVDFEIMFAAAA